MSVGLNRNTEQKILEAAENLFMTQGFMKTTTVQIAKQAGCNAAMLHYYYRTKEQLFDKIYGEKIQLMFQNIGKGMEEGTLEERIRGVVDAHWAFLTQNPLIVQFILREGLNNPEMLPELFVDKIKANVLPRLQQVDEYLKQEAEAGNIAPIPVLELLMTIVSLDVAPFLISPIFKKVFTLSDAEMREMMERRKEEVLRTVLARLRK